MAAKATSWSFTLTSTEKRKHNASWFGEGNKAEVNSHGCKFWRVWCLCTFTLHSISYTSAAKAKPFCTVTSQAVIAQRQRKCKTFSGCLPYYPKLMSVNCVVLWAISYLYNIARIKTKYLGNTVSVQLDNRPNIATGQITQECLATKVTWVQIRLMHAWWLSPQSYTDSCGFFPCPVWFTTKGEVLFTNTKNINHVYKSFLLIVRLDFVKSMMMAMRPPIKIRQCHELDIYMPVTRYRLTSAVAHSCNLQVDNEISRRRTGFPAPTKMLAAIIHREMFLHYTAA